MAAGNLNEWGMSTGNWEKGGKGIQEKDYYDMLNYSRGTVRSLRRYMSWYCPVRKPQCKSCDGGPLTLVVLVTADSKPKPCLDSYSHCTAGQLCQGASENVENGKRREHLPSHPSGLMLLYWSWRTLVGVPNDRKADPQKNASYYNQYD